jgi:hypothetical protein
MKVSPGILAYFGWYADLPGKHTLNRADPEYGGARRPI